MRKVMTACVVLGLAGSAWGQPVAALRGDFEAVAGGKPAGWREHTWGGRAQFLTSSDAHGGKNCVQVTSEAGADAGWTTIVPVAPNSKYLLSGWIKTRGVEPVGGAGGSGGGQGVVFNLHGRREHSRPILGTADWTRVEVEIETGADDELQVNCCFGYFGLAKGTAWFDDLALTLVSTREVKSEVVIDAAAAREPMSKYIYAQFIEHLGRCIYGGIWAEMLEDRKFYWGVGEGESPWKAFGGARAAMVEAGAFSGDHSPRIEGPAGAGIEQGGLELRGGVDYVGSIWTAGEGPVTVRLEWGEAGAPGAGSATTAVTPTAEWGRTELRFVNPPAAKSAKLRVVKGGEGAVRVGAVSLMPADNVRGMRKDTLELLKELDSPLYRWPGGNFVSGYEWRDGIGDRDRRPTRKNPAWRGIDSNDFGVHEFMDFCAEIGTEPLVVVNTGFGDSYSAAQWVEYMNGARSTAMGSVRAGNGRADPYGVQWWGVGNEMWGSWQLGYMALGQYTIKHNDFVKRMRKVDPGIKVVGSSDLGGGWTEGMLRACSGTMDLISEHFYCQEKPSVPSHVAAVPAAIRAKAEAHRELRKRLPELKGKDIRIAMDEWNYWYGPEVFGELGTRYFMKDALGIAAGLHEYARCTDVIFMANYAQTVNVIGAIKTSKTRAGMETTGQVLALYRKRFGTLPVEVGGSMGRVDVAAAWTADRKAFTVAVVNPTAGEQTVKVEWKGVRLGDGAVWTLRSDDPQAYNDPDRPEVVKVVEAKAPAPGGELKVTGYSVTLWRWEVEGK